MAETSKMFACKTIYVKEQKLKHFNSVQIKELMLNINNYIFPTPPLGQDTTQGQFLSGV